MLTIIVGQETHWDEANEEFVELSGTKLELEHSLVSLSKWESEFQRPFLEAKELTSAELLGYVRAMILTPNISDEILLELSSEDFLKINDYIGSPQTATTFRKKPTKNGPGEIVTSELIYYWMVAFNIPFECQTWHLNRLLTLVKICDVKNSKPTKQSKAETARQMASLNAERKAALGTNG